MTEFRCKLSYLIGYCSSGQCMLPMISIREKNDRKVYVYVKRHQPCDVMFKNRNGGMNLNFLLELPQHRNF